MSKDKKLFSDPRWNDTSKPNIIGYVEVNEAERAAGKKKLREHLKKIGVLKKEENKD